MINSNIAGATSIAPVLRRAGTDGATPRFPVIHASQPTTLRAVGRGEYRQQDFLVDDPTRPGLGQVTIKAKELRQHGAKGGRLDMLAYDAALNTYYDVEVMLGQCDAGHGFRALDYWARERVRNPNARHVA